MTDQAKAGHAFEAVVRGALDLRGLSISGLASATSIDRGRWHIWFRGDAIPRLSTLRRAVDVLGLPIEQLVEPWGELIEPGARGPDSSEIGHLISALDRQADALSELAAQVKALVESQPIQAQQIGEAVALVDAPTGVRSMADHRRRRQRDGQVVLCTN